MQRTNTCRRLGWCCAWLVVCRAGALAAEPTPAERRAAAQEFHLRAQERTGLLVPLYVYPADIHVNAAFNRLIELKRQYESVPVWVIVNPASGPGEQQDANYVKAIDRLQGAGCVTLGYVSTRYGQRTLREVTADLDRWQELYPRIQGIFFDEMLYEDSAQAVARQVALADAARTRGCWPLVANPGTDTPGRYFAADAADVFIVHEGDSWPEEARLHGDYFGGYADYPPFTRAILVHSAAELDAEALAMARRYVRWIYVTHAPYRPNDPQADNPWDELSEHLEALFAALARTP